MAKGGTRAGAASPKGSTNRPQIRDYFTDENVLEVVEMLKTHMVDDINLLKFSPSRSSGTQRPRGRTLAANLSASDRKAIDSLRDLLK